MNPSTGVISGTPTAASGSTNLTFQVTDSTSPSQTNSAVLSLAVDGSGSPTTVYSYSIAYDAVGNVTAYNDSVNGFWTMMTSDGISGYDWLNQLEAAQAISGPYAGLQVNWDYDSFGNRTEENFTGSYSGTAGIPPSTNVSYNGNNQVTSVNGGSGFSYDATGDVTQDSENQYLYDADGRVCAAYDMLTHIMTGYLYDADGNRIAKGAISSFSCDTTQNGFTLTNSYILTPGGQQLTEMTWSGGTAQWSHTNVWAAGAGLIATYSPDSSGQTAGILNFELNDWLGTRRVLTKSDGTIQQTCESLPYGNGETCAPTPTEHLYTQHERDAETNNDYFGARYYSSDAGRFLTPDWSAKTEPVPYAKLDDPQSLNLYSYVGDNPLGGVDEFGHQSQDVCNAVNCSPFNDNTDKAQTANLQAQQQSDPTLPTAEAPPPAPLLDRLLLPQTPGEAISLAVMVGTDGLAEAGAALARGLELSSAMGKTADFVTLAVTETKEGTTVVSSSEKALRPAVRALLKPGEVAAKGANGVHAEVTGVNAARQMGLTPTGVAASRGICPSCADFLRTAGVAALSALKGVLPF